MGVQFPQPIRVFLYKPTSKIGLYQLLNTGDRVSVRFQQLIRMLLYQPASKVGLYQFLNTGDRVSVRLQQPIRTFQNISQVQTINQNVSEYQYSSSN